jgi:hypothetical protein
MNPALQQLKDIHLPPAIKMWPTSPGWLALYGIIAVLLAYLAYLAYRNQQRKKTVNYALAMLKKLALADPQEINIATEISILLRRTALHYFRREDIAGLTGDSWLSFLNRSGNTTQFTDGAGRLLVDAPYRKDNPLELMPLFTLTQNWLMTISKTQALPAENRHHV